MPSHLKLSSKRYTPPRFLPRSEQQLTSHTSLRAAVRRYFEEVRLADSKKDSRLSEARDVQYIVVDNEKEAVALENNLIKQWKPRVNIVLRDDKTYPYIKRTGEKYPRVYVTRRL